jgi:anti-sigma regulatory factor (Ser/Thr protein kinase)
MEKSRADKIRAFILNNVAEHPKNIVAVTTSAFAVSRTTVHRHINTLLKNKKIVKTGTTQNTRYFLFGAGDKSFIGKLSSETEEYQIWKTNFEQDFRSLNENVYDICEYGFTEILNNVIDHSEGSRFTIETIWDSDTVQIFIIDNGVGIFKKIQNAFGLENTRESILQLTKGKLTTDPENHTGEGIFFSSRAFDEFAIIANNFIFLKNNLIDDWYFEKRLNKSETGTGVSMKISVNSKKLLRDIFTKYQSSGTMEFDKTHILVELSKLEDERYISRSQAKRLLTGLNKFHEVILDFDSVKTVGQGFVDEVFRVYKNKYPQINITYQNANNDVKFMIERGIPKQETD